MEQLGTILVTIVGIYFLGVIPSLALIVWGAWFSKNEFKEESKIKIHITCTVTGLVAYFIFIQS